MTDYDMRRDSFKACKYDAATGELVQDLRPHTFGGCPAGPAGEAPTQGTECFTSSVLIFCNVVPSDRHLRYRCAIKNRQGVPLSRSGAMKAAITGNSAYTWCQYGDDRCAYRISDGVNQLLGSKTCPLSSERGLCID